MYVYDFICTYKKFDKNVNEIINNSDSEDEDDDTLSDMLYQAQFLQIFNCEDNYDDEKVKEGLNEVRKVIESHPLGRKFIEEAVKQGLPPMLSIFSGLGGQSKDALIDTILRSYYGWASMDLIHQFACKIKKEDEILEQDYKHILREYKRLYEF
jgi:hypothetical protein